MKSQSCIKNLLIGSRALNYWHDCFDIKENTDWDLFSDNITSSKVNGVQLDVKPMSYLNNYEFEKYTSDLHTINAHGLKIHVVSLKGLAIIKRSHLWRDLSFDKHITHYHKHLAKYLHRDCDADDTKILQNRTTLTQQTFPQTGPNLNKTISQFFDDAVEKKYNHDWLHELYAYNEKPMYTKMQIDSTVVKCHKELWNTFSHTEKLQTVAEEVYVIATERFLVKDAAYPAKLAYYHALAKVCTTLCSGWFRDYAIDFYPDIREMFDANKIKAVMHQLT